MLLRVVQKYLMLIQQIVPEILIHTENLLLSLLFLFLFLSLLMMYSLIRIYLSFKAA